MLVGSPEWFNSKANTRAKEEFRFEIEKNRKLFIDEFAPSKLKVMSGEELLDKVFGNGKSMLSLLMYDSDYGKFGSIGKYKYLWYLYETDGEWKYNEKNNAVVISYYEAKKKAEELRNLLMDCISCIEKHIPLNSIADYEALDKEISINHIYKRMWVLKYYQMLYPQFFPCMYEKNTLERALNILGLPSHSDEKRILNLGEISLFTRKCDINNIVFGSIYGDEWGWESKKEPCKSAKDNYANSFHTLDTVNKSYYLLEDDTKRLVEEIDDTISKLHLEGKEREALIKVRVNQSVFRQNLIQKYHKCCLCLVDVPSMLVASHIKPWSESEKDEKLDADNGLLLCPNHDKLFDQGYITFDDNGAIVISEEVNQRMQMCMNISPDLKIDLSQGNKKYMKFHRENLFKG